MPSVRLVVYHNERLIVSVHVFVPSVRRKAHIPSTEPIAPDVPVGLLCTRLPPLTTTGATCTGEARTDAEPLCACADQRGRLTDAHLL